MLKNVSRQKSSYPSPDRFLYLISKNYPKTAFAKNHHTQIPLTSLQLGSKQLLIMEKLLIMGYQQKILVLG